MLLFCFFQAYDVNFFLERALTHPKVRQRELRCIPHSDSRLKNLSVNSYDFRDSLNYITASLDKAVADHKIRRQEFKIVKQSKLIRNPETMEIDPERQALVEEAKGGKKRSFFYKILFSKFTFSFLVMCYEYLSSWDKLNEEKLPEKSKFYSSLSRKGISDSDFDRANKFFNTFGSKNIGEYCLAYCESGKLYLTFSFFFPNQR